MVWRVQLGIPLDARLVRRASPEATRAYLARELVRSVNGVPVGFLDESVERLRGEVERQKKLNSVLVTPEGRPFRL